MIIFTKAIIKINFSILALNYNLKSSNLIIEFIKTLDFKTKFLVNFGSIVFFFYYYSLVFFFSKKVQHLILQNTPLINKILNFYRKLILVSTYE